MRLAVAAVVVAGCYSPSYKDCEVTCASNNGCPSGLTCDMALGACRLPGAGPTCGSTVDDAPIDVAIDSSGCGFSLFSNFDPCTLMGTMGDVTITQTVTYNTDTGTVNGSPFPGLGMGTLLTQGNGPNIRMLQFGTLHITPTGSLTLVGRTPVLIAAFQVNVEGALDLNAANNVTTDPACTAAPGIGTTYGGGGGGGGGLAALGGKGGESGDQTTLSGRAAGGGMRAGGFSPLLASCPGRNGGMTGDSTAGVGGAAGGSIQITARDQITVSGSIRANGAGGGGATSTGTGTCSGGSPCGAGGGGGGAGGVIYLESPAVMLSGTSRLCANGGGGGGGAGGTPPGGAGGGGLLCSTNRPSGGTTTGSGGAGGPGGSVVHPSGDSGGDSTIATGGGGGGGGSVGRIGIRATTSTGTPMIESPAIETLQ